MNELEKLGETKKHDYTTEQLLDSNLKNVEGESAEEVRNRMNSFMSEILENSDDKKIAVVSHGAAIKFFLQGICEFSLNEGGFIYNKKIVAPTKIASPSLVKLRFENRKIIEIEYEE